MQEHLSKKHLYNNTVLFSLPQHTTKPINLHRADIFQTDGRLHRRGARENKFGYLRSEIFRETRKKVKKQDNGTYQFSQKVFQVLSKILP